MSVKWYQLYCDYCGYKRITDGSDIHDLREIITSPIPGGTPQLKPAEKKAVTPILHAPAEVTNGTIISKSIPQRKKFKCPKCGRVVMARQIQRTEHETDNLDGREASTQGPSFP